MNEPDSPGGPVRLFVVGKNGNVGFPSGFSRTDNLLFGLRKQSQSVGHSKHVFVYQLPILIVSLDCLVRVGGHVLIVVLARVSSQLVCDGVASPVVFGDLTVVLILLRLMSWHLTSMGSALLATIAFSQNCHRSPSGLLIHRVGLWLLSLILLKPLTTAWLSIAIVMGLGAYVAMMAAVSYMRVELLMEELIVCCLFVTLPLGYVSSISMLCSG